jgi:hypothetical protein
MHKTAILSIIFLCALGACTDQNKETNMEKKNIINTSVLFDLQTCEDALKQLKKNHENNKTNIIIYDDNNFIRKIFY